MTLLGIIFIVMAMVSAMFLMFEKNRKTTLVIFIFALFCSVLCYGVHTTIIYNIKTTPEKFDMYYLYHVKKRGVLTEYSVYSVPYDTDYIFKTTDYNISELKKHAGYDM